jgi:hypothetical protein
MDDVNQHELTESMNAQTSGSTSGECSQAGEGSQTAALYNHHASDPSRPPPRHQPLHAIGDFTPIPIESHPLMIALKAKLRAAENVQAENDRDDDEEMDTQANHST